MSILIDQLIKQNQPMSEEFPGRWYVAKPLLEKRPLWYRFKEACKVLVGNHVYTYHYKADERKSK